MELLKALNSTAQYNDFIYEDINTIGHTDMILEVLKDGAFPVPKSLWHESASSRRTQHCSRPLSTPALFRP